MKFQNLLTADTLADLKSGRDFKDGQLAYLRGKTTSGDGLQGFFEYAESNITTADDTNVIAPLDANGNAKASGRWLRVGGAFAKGTSIPAAAQPTSGSVTLAHKVAGNVVTTTVTLAAARIPVTDAAASGSSGSLKLFDFPEGYLGVLASRYNFTAFAEGAALTGAAGDAAFKVGLGTVAADAGDGALSTTEQNIVAASATITLVGGTVAVATVGSVTPAGIDGTAGALACYLNWSGTAATIDANSYIDVTGSFTIVWTIVGDD